MYYWKTTDSAATELVSASTRGMPAGMVVSDQSAPSFSKDGQRLYLGTAPPPPAPPADGSPEPRGVDLWHWKDPLLQPMQRVRAQQERNRSYRAVVHLADRRFVQLATPEMPGLTPGDDPNRALGTDDLPYRQEVSWDTNYGDMYLVDLKTGQRKKINERFRTGAPMTVSPGGRFLLYFDESQNFDPAKKYPLMVYIYEELSEGLHNYRTPGPGTSINITRYVSNGYVVLMPDIAYDTGYPRSSSSGTPIFWVEKVKTPYLSIHNDEDDASP